MSMLAHWKLQYQKDVSQLVQMPCQRHPQRLFFLIFSRLQILYFIKNQTSELNDVCQFLSVSRLICLVATEFGNFKFVIAEAIKLIKLIVLIVVEAKSEFQGQSQNFIKAEDLQLSLGAQLLLAR